MRGPPIPVFAFAFGAGAAVALIACGKSQPQPQVPEPTIASMAELGTLMKNEINPAFSRLSFLVFHGDTVESDPTVLAGELERNAGSLQLAVARLRALPSVPTRTEEGRQVFFTYAESVEQSTGRLVEAIATGQRNEAATQMERIADICNSCHHFFRLRIEDAVLPARSAPQ